MWHEKSALRRCRRCAALFWTLEQGLGYYYFTPDVRWAWAAAFELLSSALQADAAETS